MHLKTINDNYHSAPSLAELAVVFVYLYTNTSLGGGVTEWKKQSAAALFFFFLFRSLSLFVSQSCTVLCVMDE